MSLRLMKRFFDTVDEDRRSPIADDIAERWFLGEKDVSVFRASANFVTRVKAGERAYYLRFNHSSERTPETMEAELSYIRHLIRRGVHANKPVKSLTDRYVESVETGMGLFHAVVFEGLPGKHVESDTLDLRGFERWGRALGEMHSAGAGYEDEGIPTWEDHIKTIRRVVPATDEIVLGELGSLEEKLATLPVGENYGVTHYDFEQDNLLWTDGSPGVLDFDDCAHYWYASDVANALRDLYDDRLAQYDLHDPRIRSFIEGYRTRKTITDEDIQSIPLFIRFHNLYMYARITRAMEGGVIPGEPEWVTKIRGKLGNKNQRYRDDFLNNPLKQMR
ncbi:phosphotransferase [Candidatus Bathyarchaeota archaeon]|nr:phosphotransferase [Candidatus Bathyarchaeota archaeon]